MGLRVLKKFLLAIPARLSSTRLPNKILADINGKPMLQHVLERCSKVERDIEIVVCTDSDQVVNLCKKLGFKYLLTSEKCNSGTERIASVINKLVEIRYKITIDSYEDKNFQEYLKFSKNLMLHLLFLFLQLLQCFIQMNKEEL